MKAPPTQARDSLQKKLKQRPDRQCLVQHHILEGWWCVVGMSGWGVVGMSWWGVVGMSGWDGVSYSG